MFALPALHRLDASHKRSLASRKPHRGCCHAARHSQLAPAATSRPSKARKAKQPPFEKSPSGMNAEGASPRTPPRTPSPTLVHTRKAGAARRSDQSTMARTVSLPRGRGTPLAHSGAFGKGRAPHLRRRLRTDNTAQQYSGRIPPRIRQRRPIGTELATRAQRSQATAADRHRVSQQNYRKPTSTRSTAASAQATPWILAPAKTAGQARDHRLEPPRGRGR